MDYTDEGAFHDTFSLFCKHSSSAKDKLNFAVNVPVFGGKLIGLSLICAALIGVTHKNWFW